MRTSSTLLVKRGAIGLGLTVVVVGLMWSLWPKPILVDVADVRRGPIVVTVDEEGKTRIKDVFTVSAPISGKLVRLSLEAGDRVKKDTTIVANIEPMAPAFLDVRATRELEAQLEAAKAAVALAEAEVNLAAAELEFAQSDLRRAQSLIKNKIISERALERSRVDVDTRQAALTRARANLDVRKRELESSQARLIGPEEAWKGEVPAGCCVAVRAPVSGRVLRTIQESERVVVAGTPLLEIGDPGNLEIVVDLLSADAVRVVEGAVATIEGWGGPPVSAKVTRVEPAGFTKVSALGIEEQRVRTLLRPLRVEDFADRMGHEFRVFVRIIINQSVNVVRLPIGALFRKGEQWAVYVVEDGRARSVAVEIAERNASFAEVRNGLTEGASVILHPSDRVADGVRVVRQGNRD